MSELRDLLGRAFCMLEEFQREKEEFQREKEAFRREKEEFQREKEEFQREKEEFQREKEAFRREQEAERESRRVVPTGTHRRTEEDKFQELGLKWRDIEQRKREEDRAGNLPRNRGKKSKGKRCADHYPGTSKLRNGNWLGVPSHRTFRTEIGAHLYSAKFEFVVEEIGPIFKALGFTEWEDSEAEPFDTETADEEAEEDDEPYFTVKINGKYVMVMKEDHGELKAGSVYELTTDDEGDVVPGKQIGTWEEGKFVPLPAKKPTIVVKPVSGRAGGGGAGGGGARTPVNP